MALLALATTVEAEGLVAHLGPVPAAVPGTPRSGSPVPLMVPSPPPLKVAEAAEGPCAARVGPAPTFLAQECWSVWPGCGDGAAAEEAARALP
jgi:hypothetical protein